MVHLKVIKINRINIHQNVTLKFIKVDGFQFHQNQAVVDFKNVIFERTSYNYSLLEPFKAKTDMLGVNKIAPSMDQNISDPSPKYSYYGPNTPKEKSLPKNKVLPIAKSTFNDKSNTRVKGINLVWQ